MLPGKMGKMLQKAQKAQQQMQEEIAALQRTGSAGGGAVTATVDGQKNLLGLEISAEAMEDPDPTMIADLVIAAVGEAQRAIDEEVERKMQAMAGSLGLPPGMGL